MRSPGMSCLAGCCLLTGTPAGVKHAVLSFDQDLCPLQRCKHFEIGGDTKKKNQVCVDVCCGG